MNYLESGHSPIEMNMYPNNMYSGTVATIDKFIDCCNPEYKEFLRAAASMVPTFDWVIDQLVKIYSTNIVGGGSVQAKNAVDAAFALYQELASIVPYVLPIGYALTYVSMRTRQRYNAQ